MRFLDRLFSMKFDPHEITKWQLLNICKQEGWRLHGNKRETWCKCNLKFMDAPAVEGIELENETGSFNPNRCTCTSI